MYTQKCVFKNEFEQIKAICRVWRDLMSYIFSGPWVSLVALDVEIATWTSSRRYRFTLLNVQPGLFWCWDSRSRQDACAPLILIAMHARTVMIFLMMILSWVVEWLPRWERLLWLELTEPYTSVDFFLLTSSSQISSEEYFFDSRRSALFVPLSFFCAVVAHRPLVAAEDDFSSFASQRNVLFVRLIKHKSLRRRRRRKVAS